MPTAKEKTGELVGTGWVVGVHGLENRRGPLGGGHQPPLIVIYVLGKDRDPADLLGDSRTRLYDAEGELMWQWDKERTLKSAQLVYVASVIAPCLLEEVGVYASRGTHTARIEPFAGNSKKPKK